MNLSTPMMSLILGLIGTIAYIAAPFLGEEKKAVIARVISEVLFAMMFLYLGHLAGISYCLFLALSIVVEKQIEHNRIFSFLYGIVACAATLFLNNSGTVGVLLALSLILIFLHLDEKKMMTFSSYIDILTSVILLTYCVNVKAWGGVVFAVLLLISAIAGMVSAVKLTRAGGMKAVAAENRAYQRQQAEKKQERTSKKKAKKI